MEKSGQIDPEPAAVSRCPPTIPNEIFFEIFSYFRVSSEMEPAERKRILFKLSFVCSSFRTALLPHLFSQLVLNASSAQITPSVSFCLALIDGDAHARSLAVHVRTCRISYYSSPSTPVAMPATTRCYQALPWIPNIECLVLSSSDIDKKFWKVIGSLPMLKTLKIHYVSFQGDIPVEMDRIAGLQVSSLIIEPQVFLFPQSLNVAVLSELSCDLDTLNKFLTRGPISALETLSIDSRSVFSMQSLMQVLSQIPSVDNLTICSEPSVEGPKVVPRDFPALLPNLRSLACHQAFLALLAPGRPLVNLNVWGRDGPSLNLSAVLGSRGSNTASLDITRLDIPLAVYLTVGHLPRLHKLTLGFSPAYTDLPGSPDPGTTTELMELIVDACDKWAVNSSVRRLCITAETSFDPMDLDLVMQHTMLFGSLLQKFPALRRFRLGYRVKWERFAVDEEWRVFVPIKYRAGIVEEFEAGGPSVVDYDGYLRRLSTSNLP